MKRSRHATDLIFVLSLFCLFTVLSLFVVIQGADVYQGISREMSANYSARGTVAYLTEKVRQNDPGKRRGGQGNRRRDPRWCFPKR